MDLKPCPFCGSSAKYSATFPGMCYCSCEADTMTGVEDWNRRPLEDALSARVAELEAENAQLREARDNRPWIVCLCGSTRFIDAFRSANLRETIAGHIVLSIGCDTKSDADLIALGELTTEAKAALDELHKRKIDLADEVFVLNVGGYIGTSTRSEIEYAIAHDKPLRWLEARAALVQQ